MRLNETFVSHTEDRDYISPTLLALMRTISFAIICVNGIVLTCLMRGRHTFPSAYWYQIVCITSSDIIAGLSSLLMSFVDWPFFGEHIIACSMTVGVFFVSQCAILYNILAISISRFVVLKGLQRKESPWKKVHTMYGTMTAWGVSIILCSTPFVVWSDTANFSHVNFCSMSGIFSARVGSAMKVLLLSFLVPLIITDVLYCVLFMLLTKELKVLSATANLGPAGSITSIRSVNRDDSMHRIPGDETQTVRCQGVQTESSTAADEPNSGEPSCDILHSFLTSYTKPEHSEHDIELKEFETRNGIQEDKCQSRRQPMTGIATSVQPGNFKATVPVIRIHKAFALLGFILLALNVFTWPGLIALMMGSMLKSSHFSRSFLYPLFSTLTLNSLVNPVLYTVRVPEFRDAFFSTFALFNKRECCSRRSLDV